MTHPTQSSSPEGETLREKQYAAARKRIAKFTASQIDDWLNRMDCEPALRDELVERWARLEAVEAALRPFAEAARDGSDVALSEVPLEHFARAAELIPEEAP